MEVNICVMSVLCLEHHIAAKDISLFIIEVESDINATASVSESQILIHRLA